MKIVIELAGPPRGKGTGRAVSIPGIGARIHSNPATVKYETQLRHAATQIMAGHAPIEGPVRVIMTVRFPIPQGWSRKKRADALAGREWPTKKPDWDNSGKLCDALNQCCFVDDKQVVVGIVRKVYSDRPGMTIEIDTLPLDQPIADVAPLMGGILAGSGLLI